jgi:hypothetical protein
MAPLLECFPSLLVRAERQRRHTIIAGRVKSSLNWFEWNLLYIPMQLAEGLLLLKWRCCSKSLWTKSGFDHLSIIESSVRQRAYSHRE